MKDDAWYFDYGSNLLMDPQERPTDQSRETVRCRLKDYRLAFNKCGAQSELCANIMPEPTEEVWGVLYRYGPAEISDMSRNGNLLTEHYSPVTVTVETESGALVDAVTHMVRDNCVSPETAPSADCLCKTLKWARQKRLPWQYIQSIELRYGRSWCDERERPWRRYRVDKNLKNSWLEQLSSLKCFDFRGICEGHAPMPYLVTMPQYMIKMPRYISLELKHPLLQPLKDDWYRVGLPIQMMLENGFSSADTIVTIRFSRRGTSSHTGFSRQVYIYYSQECSESDGYFTVLISARNPKAYEESDELKNEWFERCIASCIECDEKISAFLKAHSAGRSPGTYQKIIAELRSLIH
jgi:cation transport regulator ChaC